MDFGFTEDQQKFREEVREFCKKTPKGKFDPELGYSPSSRARLAEKGWLGLTFPKEYGGQGLDYIYGTILTEEMSYWGLGMCAMPQTIDHCVGIILKYGSEEMKKEYLPRIARNELTIGQAFTEPEAGSDLASVQTRAIRQGSDYIVNGQKMFCSHIHTDQYEFLMARTDPDAPKEKGLSFFLLDTKLPGITVIPMTTMAGTRTNQVFFDDVKIPREYLVGEENQAWSYFMEFLPFYWHMGFGIRVGQRRQILDTLIQYTKQTKIGGNLLIQDRLVRQKLAQAAIDTEAIRTLLYRMAWMATKGLDILDAAAILAVYNDEALFKFTNVAMQILGLYGQLQAGSKYAPLRGMIEMLYRDSARTPFGHEGGPATAKNYIAHYILGLPGCYSYICAR